MSKLVTHIYELVDGFDGDEVCQTLGVFLSKKKAVNAIKSLKEPIDDTGTSKDCDEQLLTLRKRKIDELAYSNVGETILCARLYRDFYDSPWRVEFKVLESAG